MVNITVDGARIRTPEGTSVLDAALEAGICIPNLCHVPGVSPIGACRVCLVAVVENGRRTHDGLLHPGGAGRHGRPGPLRGCSARTAEYRGAAIGRGAELQGHTGFGRPRGGDPVRYPMRHKDCVLCGRCVRVCDEVWQSRSLGFVGRGSERHVALPFDVRPDVCKHCNNCVDICVMKITPCPGLPESGICGLCESQTMMVENIEDTWYGASWVGGSSARVGSRVACWHETSHRHDSAASRQTRRSPPVNLQRPNANDVSKT